MSFDGVATKTKLGVIGDGDYTITPQDGAMAVDESNNRLYVRVNGVWRYATLT